MVELTTPNDNPVYINADEVAAIIAHKTYTSVILKSGEKIKVTESVYEVKIEVENNLTENPLSKIFGAQQ